MSSRAVDAFVGVFFAGLAGAVVVYAAPLDIGSMAVVGVLALLGVDGVLAALADRRSLMSRIGPLP